MSLKGRNIVVSGGTGTLGTAVVHTLLSRGARVFVPAFEDTLAADWPHRDHDDVVVDTGIDLTARDGVDRYYDAIGDVWASVHCAGGFAYAGIGGAALAPMWAMNAQTAFLCSRAAVRRFRATGAGGRIVNVASRQALMPLTGANTVAYTMSKAAVAALTQALAAEVEQDGIMVNAVAPRILDTPANRAAMPDADPADWTRPSAVASVIAWLVSPDNEVASGALVPVFGGG